MKSNIVVLIIIVFVFALALAVRICIPDRESSAADETVIDGAAIDAAHNSRNSLDWEGVYAGRIPETDGPGIHLTITLRDDLTYVAHYQYIDRKDKELVFSGTFTWDEGGDSVILDMNGAPSRYLVGETVLIQMGMEEKPIAYKLKGYQLTKAVSN
ncbi:MAG: copper resistance protein NlpE [Burkholderiales bacterium]|nr:copper resistance protein NlpE [Burkholderiales bacterium]